MAGLASSPLSALVPGLLCVCHQFLGPFLILLFFSCFLSQEELCKVHELKDSCTAPCCAVLGAYLSLKRCILILSLLFWLLFLQGIEHALWDQGLTEFNLGNGCFPFPWNYWLELVVCIYLLMLLTCSSSGAKIASTEPEFNLLFLPVPFIHWQFLCCWRGAAHLHLVCS